MTMRYVRRWMVVGSGALSVALGACQLVSGLSGYHETGGAGGMTTHTTSTTQGTGGVTTTSRSAGGGGAGGAPDVASASASSSSGMMCNPGMTACGNECVDLSSNPAHCGSCTVDCSDPLSSAAQCTNGYCAPVEIPSTASADIVAIAASDDAVYWVTPGSGGMSNVESLHGPQWAVPVIGTVMAGATVGGLAVPSTGTGAYLSLGFTQGAKLAAGLFNVTSAGNVVPTDITTGAMNGPSGTVALRDDSDVFWVAQNGTNPFVVIESIGSTGVVTIGSLQPPNSGTILLSAAGGTVFYNSSTDFKGMTGTTSSPKVIATGVTMGNPTDLAADDTATYLYFIEGAQPTLRRVATSSGTLDPQLYALGHPQGLAAASVPFWLDAACVTGSDGSLMTSTTWGVKTSAVASGLNCPKHLAIGGKYLYFSALKATDQRAIYRLAHP